MKTEAGVMLVKDGKGWGIVYEDGRSTVYGWMAMEDAPIHDPKYCKKPSNLTYRDSPYIEEMNAGKLVNVVRNTEVKINVDTR